MSVIVTSFPITESASFYSNFFKGFVKENIELKFQDAEAPSIIESGGNVRIQNWLTGIVPSAGDVGKTLVITSGDYIGQSGLITNWGTVPNEFFVDIPFVAVDSDVTFYIKETNMRLSYRFAEFTTQDDQDAINLFGTDFIFYPDSFGRLFIDISLISSLMKPSFEFTDEINTDMSKVYQVQYKTIYDGSSEAWVSAHDSGLTAFVPFNSVHAGGRIAKYDNSTAKASPDNELLTKMWRGYKKIYTSLIVGDNIVGDLIIEIIEYNSAKGIISTTNFYTTTDANGLVNVTIPTLNASTRYLKLSTIDDGSLDAQENITVFDTLLDETEFYLTWASELGTIRNWLFTSKIEFGNKARYDVLQDTDFRQIPNRYDEKLLLQTKGLSKIEKDYLYDIYLSNKILILNDGNEIECIVSKPSFSFENRSNSYICTIEIQKKQRDLMNV